MASPHDADQGQHVRQRTSSSALDSDSDQEVADILRHLAKYDIRQVAEDHIPDEEHARLDLFVLAKLGPDFDFSAIRVLKVMAVIVNTCPHLSLAASNSTYDELAEFIVNNAVIDLFRYAVRTSSFKHIRRLGGLFHYMASPLSLSRCSQNSSSLPNSYRRYQLLQMTKVSILSLPVPPSSHT